MKKLQIQILQIFFIVFVIFIFRCSKKSQKIEFGIITFYYGNVLVEKSCQRISPKIKMILRSGDKIYTGNKSCVNMQLGSFGIIKINQNSEVKMERLLKETTDNIKLFLKKGQVICKLEKLKKEQDFSVETPTAVIGVRGTTFIVDASEKKRKTSVAVSEGKVEIANKQAPEKKVIITKNQTAEVTTISKIPKIINKIEINKLKQLKEIKKLKIIKNIKKIKLEEIEKYFPKSVRGINTQKIESVIKSKKIKEAVKNAKKIEEKINKGEIKKKIEASLKKKEEAIKKAKEAKKQAEKEKEKIKELFKRK